MNSAPSPPFRGAAVDEFRGPAVDEFHAAAVADGRRPRPGSQQLAGLFHLGGELVDQIDTGSDELGTVRGQMPVPDVQGVQDSAIAAMTPRGRGLEQRGALAQHLVVIRPDGGDPGTTRGGQLVEIAPAFPGFATDQRQVFGCEQHRPQNSQHLACRPDGGAVQPRLVGAPGHDLHIDG